MLVDFATAPALDELGKLVGVTRLPSASAGTTIRFTIVDGHGGVVIPAGTRVRSEDGKFAFATTANVSVDPADTEVDVVTFATTPGAEANGYTAGTVNQILDPLAFVVQAENTNTSSGGADEETDDELRARIQLAPAQFSVAGPRDAYKFFAVSASTAIIDVAVQQVQPGTVGVYPLVEGGNTPSEVLSLVEAALNDDSVRPLTDTVVVEAPTVANYNLQVNVEILEGANATEIAALVTSALNEYAAGKSSLMGQDIVLSQIISKVGAIEGVYDVSVTEPAADTVIEFNEVAILGTVTVNITGENEG